MATKLEHITPQYHTFEDDQVLTADQLNEFINYFEDQDRLSRIFLSGVGIVCGFKLQFKIGTAKKEIIITQGTGITTDGDLIKLQKSVENSTNKIINVSRIKFTHYKKFEDKNALYPFFIDGENQIELWEAIPEEIASDEKTLDQLNGLQEKIVLLYLEAFEKEPGICTPVGCDNLGTEQVSRLRVLLISEDDANIIIENDTIYNEHNVHETYLSLPVIAAKRVILNDTNASDYNKLKTSYYNAIIQDNVLVDLKDGIHKMLSKLSKGNEADLIVKEINDIFNIKPSQVPTDFQYRYDLLKDIIDTYNEARCLFLSLNAECNPDIKSFPKHLFLGKIAETKPYITYRHQFYKSPIITDNDEKFVEFINLFDRIIKMLKEYNILIKEIKITPSNFKVSLGDRAIPFYFNINKSFLNTWNYQKTKCFQQDTNLSYHIQELNTADEIQNPLDYNIDGYDFYRIEGHQGTSYTDAIQEIDKIKTQKGLAFDVKALCIDALPDNIDIEDYECEFEDLAVLLSAWRAEQECVLAKMVYYFSAFSIEKPGDNHSEKQPGINATLVKGKEYMPNANNSICKKNKVVEKNLFVAKDTLGSLLEIAIKKNRYGSVYDIIASANHLVAQSETINTWDKETKEATIDMPIQLVASSQVVTQLIPMDLGEVTNTKVNKYVESVEQLCAILAKFKQKYNNPDFKETSKAFTGLLINQLANVCCSAKKIEILLAEIKARKLEILSRIQLSKFIEKHPGLEHKAGVKPGGTFILVYLKKGLKLIGKGLWSFAQIPTNTVIADFSLPYSCCSDCSPIAFIVEKKPVSLHLPADTFCLGTDTSPLPFEVSPEDGIIKADKEIPGMEINNETKELSFIPEDFPDEYLEQAIGFTVNDQVTDCTITVYRSLVIEILASAGEYIWKSDLLYISYSFDLLPDNIDENTLKYNWSINGDLVSEKKLFIHDLEIKNEPNSFEVSVVVISEHGCRAEDTTSFTEDYPDFKLEIDKTHFCRTEKEAFPITVIPDIPETIVTGSGVTNNLFVPANATPEPDGSVVFSIGGGELLTVHLHNRPVVIWVPIYYEESMEILLQNNSSGDINEFKWIINGEHLDPTAENKRDYLITYDNTTVWPWTIQLIAETTYCNTLYSEIMEISQGNGFNCIESTTEIINSGATRLRKFIKSGKFKNEVPNEQQPLFISTGKQYMKVVKDINGFLSGNKNGLLYGLFYKRFTSIHFNILQAQPPALDHLINLYKVNSTLFYNILRCQDDDNLSHDGILKLFELLKSYFSKDNPDSFIVKEIRMNGNYKKFLQELQNTRTQGSIFWDHLDCIIKELT